MNGARTITWLAFLLMSFVTLAQAESRPNVVVMLADDGHTVMDCPALL